MPHWQSVAWYAHNQKLQEIAHYLADEGWQCEALYADQMMLTRTPWPGAPKVWCPPSVLYCSEIKRVHWNLGFSLMSKNCSESRLQPDEYRQETG